MERIYPLIFKPARTIADMDSSEEICNTRLAEVYNTGRRLYSKPCRSSFYLNPLGYA